MHNAQNIDRREFAKRAALGAGALLAGGATAVFGGEAEDALDSPTFMQQPLGYAFDALEPHIDARTMKIHYNLHHAGHVPKLNAALEDADAIGDGSVVCLLRNLDEVPDEKRQSVMNSGGGAANHELFWDIMSPDGGGESTCALAAEIGRTFGGFGDFKEDLSNTAVGQFGSGCGMSQTGHELLNALR